MLKHYYAIALRNLKKHPFYSITSITGLAIGTAAFIILINYANFEKGYDSFNKDYKNIYRAESYFTKNDQVADFWATSSYGYAKAMQQQLPEVQSTTRIGNTDDERMVKYNNIVYREERVPYADSNFFSFFSYPLLKGDAANVLQQPNSVVISETTSKKYFGDADPIGKVLEISTQNNIYHCAVTGVFKDFSLQSHLRFNMLISMSTASKYLQQTWYVHEAYMYVKTANAEAAARIEQAFPKLAEQFKTDDAMRDKTWQVHLVPLSQIHLTATKSYELETKGSMQNIRFIIGFAIIILIVGWINFINIMLFKASERAGEIGVRKVAGARLSDLILQFVVESFIINLSAVLLFFIQVLVIKPITDQYVSVKIFYQFWQQGFVWLTLTGTFIISTVVTGIIPALILRTIDTAKVLKNKTSFAGTGKGLRQVLITFQYFAAIVLIIVTITIKRQVEYMQQMNTGLNLQQTLVIKSPAQTDNYNQRLETLRQDLVELTGVKSVTLSSAVPGKMVGYGMSNKRAGDPSQTSKLCETLRIDENFIPAYNLQLLQGRNISKGYPTDSTDVVILTQTAMRLFGFKDENEAVNGYINLESDANKKFRVIGVVKDYHQLSLKENFRPVVMMEYNPWKGLKYLYISVKMTGSPAMVTNEVESKYKSIFPASSFDSFFLSDFYNSQYADDSQYSLMILTFTWLVIFIMCLGILGVAGFMLVRRTKEIAVRKIIGASHWQLLRLLNKSFANWIIVAFVLAAPVAYWLMYSWLQGFPYRIQIDAWSFLISVGSISIITIITVNLLAVKSININPVVSLRSE